MQDMAYNDMDGNLYACFGINHYTDIFKGKLQLLHHKIVIDHFLPRWLHAFGLDKSKRWMEKTKLE